MTFLFLAGIVCFIAAVWVYSKTDENNFSDAVNLANQSKGDAKLAIERCRELGDWSLKISKDIANLQGAFGDYNKMQTDTLSKFFDENGKLRKDFASEIEMLKVRQHTLEKKIIAKDKTLSVTSTPIQIQIIDPGVRPKPAPAKKSLLDRAGVGQ